MTVQCIWSGATEARPAGTLNPPPAHESSCLGVYYLPFSGPFYKL
jgi:hypothetical protein